VQRKIEEPRSSISNMPKLISTITHSHPATFDAGPRIERTEIYEFEGRKHVVNYWYENGNIVRVT